MVTGIGSVDNFSINIPDEYDPEQQANLDQVPIIKQRSNTVGISWTNIFKDGTGFIRTTLSNNFLKNDFRKYRDNVNQTDLYSQNLSTEEETKLRFNYTKFRGDWTLTSTATMQAADYTSETLDRVNNFLFKSNLNFAKYGFSFQASNTQLTPHWLKCRL